MSYLLRVIRLWEPQGDALHKRNSGFSATSGHISISAKSLKPVARGLWPPGDRVKFSDGQAWVTWSRATEALGSTRRYTGLVGRAGG